MYERVIRGGRANPPDRQQDEIARKDRIGDKGVKRFVRKIAGIIERITALLPGDY